MAHKTLVNGTAYEIKGGRTLISGVGYDIKNGKTLIDGVTYDTKFVSYPASFADATWAQVIEACQNNAVPDTWAVGDSLAMTINGASYQIDIIGKNHDTYTDGGTAPLTFQLQDCYGTTKYPMNSDNTNYGGWTSCEMRTSILPTIQALMPSEVQNGLKEVTKLTSRGGGSYSTILTTSDKLFLLSEIEVFGALTESFAGQGSQYAYYAAGNSKLKKIGSSNQYWWERSPCKSDGAAFCAVTNGGGAGAPTSAFPCAISFAFCF